MIIDLKWRLVRYWECPLREVPLYMLNITDSGAFKRKSDDINFSYYSDVAKCNSHHGNSYHTVTCP